MNNRIEHINEIQTVEQLMSLILKFGSENVRVSKLNIECEDRAHSKATHIDLKLTLWEYENSSENKIGESYDHAMGAVR